MTEATGSGEGPSGKEGKGPKTFEGMTPYSD